jgi:hypothetical protein
MRILIIEFMSLDGVVQAPGGPDEDTNGHPGSLTRSSSIRLAPPGGTPISRLNARSNAATER